LIFLTSCNCFSFSTSTLRSSRTFHLATSSRSTSKTQRNLVSRHANGRLHERNPSKTSTTTVNSLLTLRAGSSSIFPNDIVLSISLIGEVYIWLKFWTYLAKKQILPSKLTRKIIHTGSAPLFILHWPFYAQTAIAPYIATIIPLLQIAR
jgi:hypothetical protein